MKGSHFDAMTRLLSRRKALGAGVASSLGFRAATQEATPPATEKTEFLFVQTAASGSFAPNPDAGTPTPGGGDYLLTLEGHAGGTIYFSDRPERIFGEAPTDQFLAGLGFSPANPPNAALVTDTADGEPDVVILELTDSTYDAASGTITYGATILADYEGEGLAHVASQQQDAALPESFDHASLFIDDCPDITTCSYHVSSFSGWLDAGPIPGGPYGTCYSASPPSCNPCNESQDSLNVICNDTYPDECGGACVAE